MIISDLDHLQVVSESREVEGGNSANARASADSLARGWWSYAWTFTDTDTYTDYYTAAASSMSSSSASSY